MQQSIQTQIRRFRNFLGFAKSFWVRKNPIKMMLITMISMLKEMLSTPQKRKIAKYRVNYQMHKLREMEDMIAKNNEHAFLRGRKFNEMR